MTRWLYVLATGLMLGGSSAHPGHSVDQEIAKRAPYLKNSESTLRTALRNFKPEVWMLAH